MRIKTTYLVIVSISLAILCSCTALNLRQANHELADLYRAKIEAVNSNSWEQEVSVDAALSNLATEAADKGAAITMSDRNRISFYRIAATAAWQAGDEKVVDYAARGMALCAADNFNKAPRDCGMLSVIPGFASVDELAKKIDDFQKRLDSGQNPPTEQELVQLFNDIKWRIEGFIKNRAAIRKSSAHPQLITEIDRQTGQILCTHLEGVGGLMVQVAGTQSDAHKNAQCDDYKLQVKLKELGFVPQMAPCLPAGAPVRPDGCR